MEIIVSVEIRVNGQSLGTQQVMRVYRDEYDLRAEDIGFRWAEGKDAIHAIKQEVVVNQVILVSAIDKFCQHCGRTKPNKDRRPRAIQTVFGRVVASCYRYFKCGCLPHSGKYDWPLKRLAKDACTPEYRYLLSRWGSLLPYRQAASLLDEVLPLSSTGLTHTRRHRQDDVTRAAIHAQLKLGGVSTTESASRTAL